MGDVVSLCRVRMVKRLVAEQERLQAAGDARAWGLTGEALEKRVGFVVDMQRRIAGVVFIDPQSIEKNGAV